jgi:hypothetical protein
MHGYIEPFYEAADPGYEPGHVWNDQPIYLPARHGLKITRVNPEDDRELNYEIRGRTDDLFDHPPVFSMQLESTEAPVVAVAKKDRPVIILGGVAASEIAQHRDQPTHLEIVWAVPIYGAENYPEAIRNRIRIYDFRNFFYLPEDAALGFKEGFARLDHAQPVKRSMLRTHRGLRLTSDARDALREWYVYFTTDWIDRESMILDYRRDQSKAAGEGTDP